MRVLRLHATGDLRLHDEPVPMPAVGETLLRVKAVGVCGSDLHWYKEAGIGDARLGHPLVLGHEFTGVTEQGELMAIDPAVPCNSCEFCLQGNPNLCIHMHFAGQAQDDGALQECIAWPVRCLYRLPPSLDENDGAMLEPLGVALHAVDLGKLRAGMSVGVFGCGPIGLLVVQLARLAGATQIIATDVHAHRLQAAGAYGATQVFRADAGRESDEILSVTHQRGVDVAFEAAGANEAIETAIAVVKPGGRVILIGIPEDDRTSFSASVARRKGLTLKLVRRMKHTYPRAIQLVERKLVDVRSLVTHQFPLEQAAQAFDVAQSREGLKVIIKV